MSRRGRSRRFAGSPFFISSFYGTGGITYDWSADTGITMDGSNRISHWVDRVSGLDAAQATGANQPLFDAATVSVRLDSTARFLQTAASLPAMSAAAATLILVIQHLGNGWIFQRSDAAGASGPVYRTSAGSRIITMLGSSGATDGAYSGNFEVVTMNVADTAFAANPLTVQELYVGGVSQSLAGTTGFTQPGAASILKFGLSGSSADCKIQRAIWCENQNLTASQRGRIESALASYPYAK